MREVPNFAAMPAPGRRDDAAAQNNLGDGLGGLSKDDREAVETATVGREGAVGIMAGLGGRRAAGRAVVQVEGQASQIPVAPLRAAIDRSDGIRDLIVRYNDTQMALIQQSITPSRAGGLNGNRQRRL
jgi:hypothetical protein